MNERDEQYESLIRTLEGRIWWLEKKVDAIKFRFDSIPKRFVSESFIILNRATPEHTVWDFAKWFTGAMTIIESSQFIEYSELASDKE